MTKTKTSSSLAHWIPDPLEFAILLSLASVVASALFTPHSLPQSLDYWGDGLWSLLSFMTQMCLMLLGGFVVASASKVQMALQYVVGLPRTTLQVYLLTFFVSVAACWLNWGLGLVVSAFFALESGRVHKKAHFPLLVAVGYMGFLFWHGGLSGSIPLIVATPDNFSFNEIGRLIPVERTLFSPLNITLLISLLVGLFLYVFFLGRRLEKRGEVISFSSINQPQQVFFEEKSSVSPLFYWLLVLLFLAYTLAQVLSGTFSLELNRVNLILILVGMVLHGGFASYKTAVVNGCMKLAPILIQYPIYAGIMGVIKSSGLGEIISQAFVSVSGPETYSLLIFLSAGLLNFMVPSGGGQWAVQAPVVIDGAQKLGVGMEEVILAVAWGDAWTNLAQPFWALPLLAIVGLGIRDIYAYCFGALLLSGSIISVIFLIF